VANKYQESHREQCCAFASGACFGDVVGHHLKVGGKSLSSKTHDAMAIPVCVTHHKMCESLEIGKQEQLEAWCKYMLERLIQEHGREKGVELMALAYWSVL